MVEHRRFGNLFAYAILSIGVLIVAFPVYLCLIGSTHEQTVIAIGADKALGDVPMSSSRDAARLRFALNGELGYGQPHGATFSNGSVMSGSVGIPISLVSGSRVRNEMRI
jgi:ABC-type glycerol-3-phosphate transport system permease component